MPTLAAVLKAEIRRLASRENRRWIAQLRGLRQRIKGLKLALRTQKQAMARLERHLARGATARPGAAAGEPQVDGRRVAALRGRLQMSRVEFARLLGVSPGSIFGWEKGRTVPRGRNSARVLDLERRMPLGPLPAPAPTRRRRRRRAR